MPGRFFTTVHNENNCKLSFERGVDKETKATFRYQSDSMQRGVSFRILYFCRKESAGIHFASTFSLHTVNNYSPL